MPEERKSRYARVRRDGVCCSGYGTDGRGLGRGRGQLLGVSQQFYRHGWRFTC